MVSLPHKYDMGIVGNCSFMAYIDTSTRVQWMCMPKFDSSFIFGGLLDKEKGGDFSVLPQDSVFTSHQYYMRNTNILCTEIKTRNEHYRVTDFAPHFYHYERYFRPLMLIRKIEPLSGRPFIRVTCSPRANWGTSVPEIATASNHLRFLGFDQQVRLTTDIPLNYIVTSKPFVLDTTAYLIFTYGEPLEAPIVATSENFLYETERYWTQWIKSASIPTMYQEEVIRSALALKLHQYEDTGAIIASGTTSLPEAHNRGRNWDYRYCWLRDTFFTLNAFANIGHFEELEKYFRFIQNIAAERGSSIQPLYGISGDKLLTENELPLDGYLGNKPVRTGNNAFSQLQHDVYGHLLLCLLPLFIDQRLEMKHFRKDWHLIDWLLDRIIENIDEADSGIWEYRNSQQRFCYTYLFHWAGSKAALKIARAINNDHLLKKAEHIIAMSVDHLERCYDPDLQAYTQASGTGVLDASTLQLINMHYLDPSSERAKAHLRAIEKALISPVGLVFRYKADDDFGAPETSFLICSFWYAEALANVNRCDDAKRMLDKILKCSNHLGLFSEDADEDFGQWGNFPQTYSHVGIMNAVYRLATKLDMPFFI